MKDIFKDERKRTYLNSDGADKPLRSNIPDATLQRARTYRLSRVRKLLAETDCAAILLYDPVNIRYALDCSNMQVWTAHNPIRYALVFADGPAIMFEFKSCGHLSEGLETIDEVRIATGWMFMSAGDRVAEFVNKWADEIADLMQTQGGGNRRLAKDRMEPEGVMALQQRGLDIVEGGQITERARSIKSTEELELSFRLVAVVAGEELEHLAVRLLVALMDDAASLRQGEEDLLPIVEGLGLAQQPQPGELLHPTTG